MPLFLPRIGFVQLSRFSAFLLVDFHRFLPTHAFALSARQFLPTRKCPYEHEVALGKIRTRIT